VTAVLGAGKSWADSLVNSLGGNLDPWGYVLVFAAAAAESAAFTGLVVPGATIMLLAGFLCWRGGTGLGAAAAWAGRATLTGRSQPSSPSTSSSRRPSPTASPTTSTGGCASTPRSTAIQSRTDPASGPSPATTTYALWGANPRHSRRCPRS